MRYHTTRVGHFNPDDLAFMQPHYPQGGYAASPVALTKTSIPGGQWGFRVHALRGLGVTSPTDPQTVSSSDDVSGEVLLHVAGGALLGAAAGAFAAHDTRGAGPGALGVAGLVALFDGGRVLLNGKATTGIGIGLAGALALVGGWMLAKNHRLSGVR